MDAMDLDDPKYEPAAIRARQNMMIGVTVAMTLVGALTVGLRVFTRAYIVGTMWADDWAMCATLFFAFGYALEVLIMAKSFNVGFSGAQLSTSDSIDIIKITVAVVITYKLVLTLTKVSILCFYLRIAVRPMFAKLCKWTLGVVVLFQVILTFTIIGQCVPIQKMWDLTGAVKGKCIDTDIFYHFASLFHIITDLWILALPYKIVLSIPRPLKEKLGLLSIFSLGTITIIAAIFRLQFLHLYTVSPDPFFEIVPIHLWSMVEVNIGIVCASLPTLRPLFSRQQRSRTREIRGFEVLGKGKGVENGMTLATSGTIAIAIGETIRASYRPPVPPKTSVNGGKAMVLDVDVESRYSESHYSSRASSPTKSSKPRKLALLKRDENGIFRPEAIHQRSP